MASFAALGNRLYTGEKSIDFIGRQKLWYAISGVLIALSLVGLFGRDLNLSLEFRGGSEFTVSNAKTTNDQVGRNAVGSVDPAADAEVTKIGTNSVRVQTSKLRATPRTPRSVAALAKAYGVSQDKVSSTFIGPSWGADISKKALQGLIAFLILVSLVIAFYFRTWTMALAGIVALLHDLLITAGVYALVGFEVSPASVIGFLTILGYSLYDTVVVFDKVRENTQNLTATAKSTYSEAANLAVNQTLVRSINTSVVALLPIASILVIGTILVGAGTLEDLALALFVGIATGTYSSIFIATPLLADLRERQPEMKALRSRVLKRRAAQARPRPAAGRQGAGRRGRRRRPPTTVPAADGARTATATATRPGAEPRRRARATSPSGPRRSPAASAGEPARDVDLTRRPSERLTERSGLVRESRTSPSRASCSATSRRCSATARRSRPWSRPGPSSTPASTWSPASRPRGFILAAPLATRLGVGFVPIRKAGKLPGPDRARGVRVGVRRGRPRGDPRRRPARVSGCCSSTTCWPPAAPLLPPPSWSSGRAPRWSPSRC